MLRGLQNTFLGVGAGYVFLPVVVAGRPAVGMCAAGECERCYTFLLSFGPSRAVWVDATTMRNNHTKVTPLSLVSAIMPYWIPYQHKVITP